MARIVSLTVLTTLMVFLGITFFQVIAPFLLPLFLAGVTAVLCQPIYRYFKRKMITHPRVAAALTTLAVLSIVLVPLSVGTFVGSLELYTLAQRTIGGSAWHGNVKSLRERFDIDGFAERIKPHIEPYIGREIRPEEVEELQSQVETNVRNGLTALAQRSLGLAAGALGVLGNVVSGIIGLLMFAIALYYFLADGPVLLAATEKLIPVHVEYQRQLLTQFDKVVRAVVMATFVAAVSQGLATAAALFVCDFRHFFIIFIIATLASLIPLAGTWLVWGPCAVWLYLDGHGVQATFLTLFGIFVVGTLDNVIRTVLLQSDTKLHPLLAFVSVLGGLQVMGLWGVFIGPTVACCLHALVKIFNTELKEFSKERFGPITGQPPVIETEPDEQTEKPDEKTAPAGRKRSSRSRSRRRSRRSKRGGRKGDKSNY